MKRQILILAVLACIGSSLAQTPEAVKSNNSCSESFEAVKNVRTRNVAANRTYTDVVSRLSDLQQIPEKDRSGEKYEIQLKSCNLAVELLKAQLESAALNRKFVDIKKEVTSVQDSIITSQDSMLTDLKRKHPGK